MIAELHCCAKDPSSSSSSSSSSLRGISFLHDRIIVTRGSTPSNPELVQLEGGASGWVYKGPIAASGGDSNKEEMSKVGGALQKFREISLRDVRSPSPASTSENNNCIHSHTIAGIYPINKSAFATAGLDGRLVVWKF